MVQKTFKNVSKIITINQTGGNQPNNWDLNDCLFGIPLVNDRPNLLSSAPGSTAFDVINMLRGLRSSLRSKSWECATTASLLFMYCTLGEQVVSFWFIIGSRLGRLDTGYLLKGQGNRSGNFKPSEQVTYVIRPPSPPFRSAGINFWDNRTGDK